MPRGNDSVAALHELAKEFGDGVGNAEELIRRVQGAHTQELAAAEQQQVDVEATKALDLDKIKIEGAVHVHDAAVRGSYLVTVYEDDTGRLHQHAEEIKSAPKPSGPRTPDAANVKAKAHDDDK